MAVSPNVKVLGPFHPNEFGDTATLTTTMTTAAAGLTGGTVVSMEPVVILGACYLIATTT